MKTYTTREVADKTGKTLQAISRYAQAHPGVGQKFGRDWLFTEADLKRLASVKKGGYRQSKPAPAPEQTP